MYFETDLKTKQTSLDNFHCETFLKDEETGNTSRVINHEPHINVQQMEDDSGPLFGRDERAIIFHVTVNYF